MPHSIEHSKENGLSELLPPNALNFISSEDMKEKPLEHSAPLFLKECQLTTDQVGNGISGV